MNSKQDDYKKYTPAHDKIIKKSSQKFFKDKYSLEQVFIY